jgi:GrpB-like predicted nucleotidyltransferase (UPF0157 family)
MPAPIKVELVPHSVEWRSAAENEIGRLSTLRGSFIAIHHIGSTSIAGICAKPVLDLLAHVSSLEELDGQKTALLALGYEWWGEYGIANRRYCTLSDFNGQRRVHLHCFPNGDAEIEKHLAFRDYLRANSEEAEQYDAEKKRCRALHADDSHAYSDAKSAWIAARIPLALAYRRSLIGEK